MYTVLMPTHASACCASSNSILICLVLSIAGCIVQVQAAVLARERRTARAAANTAAGRWGDTAATDAVAEAAALADAEVVELAGQLGQLADSYRGLVRRYLSALPAAADEVRLQAS